MSAVALRWLLLGLVARIVLAMGLDLGNDEAYYRLYALYPDWSHFDHPAMLGWLTALMTGFSSAPSDMALRGLPLLCGTLSAWLVYKTGKAFGGEKAGEFTVALHTASLYCSVITGTFLMPDAPQSVFWLATLCLAVQQLPKAQPGWGAWTTMGLLISGALLSKYHSAFLVVGIWAFCALRARWHFASAGFWWMNVLGALGLLPTLLWNQSNGWISFAFHGERVQPSQGLRFDFAAQEIAGEIAYQNPVVWFLVWAALIAAGRGRWRKQPETALLLFTAIPLLTMFIGFSLFRRTLPHWTGPAYLTLLPLAGSLASSWGKRGHRLVWSAIGLFAVTVVVGCAQIRTGILTPSTSLEAAAQDVTLDLFGWEQAGDLWSDFMELEDLDPKSTALMSPGWFPAAHLDHYLAAPSGCRTYALGDLAAVHKFAWAHREWGTPDDSVRCFLVTDSRNFARAEVWRKAQLPQTSWRNVGTIERGGNPVKALFVLEVPIHSIPSITLR